MVADFVENDSREVMSQYSAGTRNHFSMIPFNHPFATKTRMDHTVTRSMLGITHQSSASRRILLDVENTARSQLFAYGKRLRVTVAKRRSPKTRIEEGIANGVLSRSFDSGNSSRCR